MIRIRSNKRVMSLIVLLWIAAFLVYGVWPAAEAQTRQEAVLWQKSLHDLGAIRRQILQAKKISRAEQKAKQEVAQSRPAPAPKPKRADTSFQYDPFLSKLEQLVIDLEKSLKAAQTSRQRRAPRRVGQPNDGRTATVPRTSRSREVLSHVAQ